MRARLAHDARSWSNHGVRFALCDDLGFRGPWQFAARPPSVTRGSQLPVLRILHTFVCVCVLVMAGKIADRGKNFNLWAHKLKFLPRWRGKRGRGGEARGRARAKPQVRNYVLQSHALRPVA